MVPPEIRQRYAGQIRTAANIRSEALLHAFAAVPREDFLGPAPWTVIAGSAPGRTQPQITEVSDPCELYRDVAVFLETSPMETLPRWRRGWTPAPSPQASRSFTSAAELAITPPSSPRSLDRAGQ